MISVGCGRIWRWFDEPVLEPNLHRALRHVDLLRNPLTDLRSRSRVLVEFHLERHELVLRRPLALLVLLLLRQGRLARRPASR